MDQKLLNKAITISAKEEKLQAGKPVVKLKDEKGLTYTVYKTKQDGSTSVAWEQLSELDLGDTVQIGYVEDIKDDIERGGKITYRTIRNFNKDIGEGMKNHASLNTSPHTEKPRGGANNASGRGSSDAFGRRLGIQGHINALLGNTNIIKTWALTPGDVKEIIKTAILIEDEAEKQINSVSEPKAIEPTIHADEDLNVEGIPF